MFISRISQQFKSIEDKIPPLGVHVTKSILTHDENYLLATIAFRGVDFEAIEDDLLHNYFLDINQVVAQLSKQHGAKLALWTHIVHEKINFEQQYDFSNFFAKQFAEKYLRRFNDKDYFENSFYLTLCYKFDDELSDGVRAFQEIIDFTVKTLLMFEPRVLGVYDEINDIQTLELLLEINEITDISAQEFCACCRYEPEIKLQDYNSRDKLLSIYETLSETGKVISFSELLEFYSLLVNGRRFKAPLSSERAFITLPQAELHFFYNYTHAQYHDEQEAFFTTYDLKGTPNKTSRGQFNQILSLPFEFILTQSFYCLPVYAASKLIDDQINKLESVQDKAQYQLDDLKLAQGLLSGGDLSFGDYHAALVVKGNTYKKASDNGVQATSTLLSAAGTTWVKSKLSAPITWLSQIPSYKMRPRSYLKPSTTLASTFSMHNYSAGKATGNPIGDGYALMPLQTKASSVYSFNSHYTRKGENNLGEKVAGHLLMLGATGVGKTATQCAIITMLERFNPRIFSIDKDRGMEIFLRTLGASYFSLKAGEPTGIAPFQLKDSPSSREFLYQLVSICGRDNDGKITAEEERQIKVAVDTVFTIAREHRRFSRLLESIPYDGDNSLHTRLARWCYSENGRYAWVLDNEKSIIDLDRLHEVSRIGFDVTDFLVPNFEPTEPVLGFLFHIKELMQERGGLMATIIEECWLPASYEITQNKILDILKTGRKREEFAVLVSQSPADVINCAIFDTIIEQTPTKIFLPNPAAKYQGGYELCNLTLKEFNALKRLNEQSRTFLIKQGNQSCFAVLDLYGMDEELSILSGTVDNVAILEEIMQEIGSENPADWYPIFQKRRKGKR